MRLVIALTAALVFLVGCGSSSGPVQYPPGQRPCKEALDALTAVTDAQLQAGSGPTDPDGTVRSALRHAKTVLSYRAGDSPYYSAASYNATADRVAATIDPLIASYDREDPNTPYEEATDYGSTEGAFGDAQIAMDKECDYAGTP